MAVPVGTSLGRHPFRIQDTFTWEDLSLGSTAAAEQARYRWLANGISKEAEPHFFEAHMSAFKENGEFTMVISVLLSPYDFRVYSSTVSLRMERAADLMASSMAYLGGLLGMPLSERIIRRYGGKIMEWLESVATMYEQKGM